MRRVRERVEGGGEEVSGLKERGGEDEGEEGQVGGWAEEVGLGEGGEEEGDCVGAGGGGDDEFCGEGVEERGYLGAAGDLLGG